MSSAVHARPTEAQSTDSPLDAPPPGLGGERYGLTWPGKAQALRTLQTPSTARLVPLPDESLEFESTANAIVEGDNLEVLKLLAHSYRDAVGLIYIDPPYNTGNDFIYPDDYRESPRSYLQASGQLDAQGRGFASNSPTDGRFHSKWLTMMFPRLALARTLLRDDGVIMVSIGEGEVHNLRAMLGELFGERNFCGTFVWEKKRKASFLDAAMGSKTEYIVTFAKDRRRVRPFTSGTVERGKMYPFNNAGNPRAILTFPAQSVRFALADRTVEPCDMSAGNIATVLLDPVEIRGGTNARAFRLEGEWRYSQASLDAFVAAGDEIVIRRLPFRPNYISTSTRAKKTANLLTIKGTGTPTYEDATAEMRRLFGEDVVEYPKPVGLLRFLIGTVARGTDLVMDFFAGSGTTAHAVLALNALDGGQRRFLLVQLPEPTGRADYPTIADITRERVRRASADIGGAPSGFRAFRVVDGGDDEISMLFDIILTNGLPLSTPFARETIAGTLVYCLLDGALLVCLARTLTPELLRALAVRRPARVTVLDAAFAGNDELKVSAVSTFAAHGIAFRTR